jgi:hypothetical protein
MTRDEIIQHILFLKQWDVDEARASLVRQHQWRPELDLKNGVRETIEKGKSNVTDRTTL